MKKIISLVLSVCMLMSIFGNMNVLAAEDNNEVMTAINDELSAYKIGDTIKVVYFKALPPAKKEAPLFSDYPPKKPLKISSKSFAERRMSSC